MSKSADQKAQTHEAILASAARLLRKRGIAGARVADVMEGAGLTVGGFYAHFASKKALVDESLRRTGEEVRARIFSGLDAKPPAERAEVILERYLSAAHRDEAEGGCPLPSVVGEVATKAREHRGQLGEEVEAFARELEPLLPKRNAPSRRQLALGLFVLMYGGVALARALRGTGLSDEVLGACRALGRFVVTRRAESS